MKDFQPDIRKEKLRVQDRCMLTSDCLTLHEEMEVEDEADAQRLPAVWSLRVLLAAIAVAFAVSDMLLCLLCSMLMQLARCH
jgi:hypothetical protein